MPIVELNIITHLEDSKRHIVDLLNIADFEQAISLFLQLSKEQKMFRFVIDDFEKVLLPKDAEYKDDVSHNVYEFLFLCDISLSYCLFLIIMNNPSCLKVCKVYKMFLMS